MSKLLYWALYEHILLAACRDRQDILHNSGLHKQASFRKCAKRSLKATSISTWRIWRQNRVFSFLSYLPAKGLTTSEVISRVVSQGNRMTLH